MKAALFSVSSDDAVFFGSFAPPVLLYETTHATHVPMLLLIDRL